MVAKKAKGKLKVANFEAPKKKDSCGVPGFLRPSQHLSRKGKNANAL